MFLKDKLTTLKLKEGESLTQHIQTFQTILAQLTSVGITTSNKDENLSFMRSIPLSYKIFFTALKDDHILTLQKLITYLIQKRVNDEINKKHKPARLLNVQFFLKKF
jgi:hypothetical protein